MAKTIKFNLICDGYPVRTLEDLRNNFSIEDVITYFNNKLLHRWLSVRGYNEELEKVEKLKNVDNLTVIKELVEIFDIEADPVTVDKNTYILQYKQEAEVLLEKYKEMNFKVSTIIDDYHTGYRQLIETIMENKNDIAKIKAAIKEIDEAYSGLYALDYHNIFYTFLNKAPRALFVMLMNENMRKKYLPTERVVNTDEKIKEANSSDIIQTLNPPTFGRVTDNPYKASLVRGQKSNYDMDKDVKEMYRELCELVSNESMLINILAGNLKSFAGETKDYWKDIEPKGKKFMILSMKEDNYVRSAGDFGGDLSFDDVNQKFLILDGINYKSKSKKDKLLYMEV
ncbi:MAG: hypothetical protein JJT76_13410 [Clostridiaceae bacterium]|nr:hypothetical protein [Clostridiaceae bacterium]